MTNRRHSYLEHWVPLHEMTIAEATKHFPTEAGIARYGQPEEITELMAFLVSPHAKFMTGAMLCMDGGEIKRATLRSLIISTLWPRPNVADTRGKVNNRHWKSICIATSPQLKTDAAPWPYGPMILLLEHQADRSPILRS